MSNLTSTRWNVLATVLSLSKTHRRISWLYMKIMKFLFHRFRFVRIVLWFSTVHIVIDLIFDESHFSETAIHARASTHPYIGEQITAELRAKKKNTHSHHIQCQFLWITLWRTLLAKHSDLPNMRNPWKTNVNVIVMYTNYNYKRVSCITRTLISKINK